MAWPTARPTMLASASGVLKQRACAERALQAVGGAEHAALALDVVEQRLAGVGDVLAEHPDALVGRHHLVQRAPDRLAEGDRPRRPSDAGSSGTGRSGSTYDVVEDRGRVGPGRGQRLLGRVGHHGARPRRGSPRPRPAVSTPASTSARAQQEDRVVRGLVGQLLGGAVLALGVGRRVRVRPGDLGVDQRRARRRPARGRSRRRRSRGLEVVAAVDLVDRAGRGSPRTISEIGAGDWSLGRHRDGVAVVGHDEEHRQVQAARGVEALPELALGRGALAERHVGELVAVGRRSRAGRGRREM